MVNKETIEAYVIDYTATGVMLGGGMGPDKSWDLKRRAVYIPNENLENQVLIKGANKEPGLIFGPLYLMYQAFVGEEAQTKWSELLEKLNVKEDDKGIKKMQVPLSVLQWGKSLNYTDNPPEEVRELLKT